MLRDENSVKIVLIYLIVLRHSTSAIPGDQSDAIFLASLYLSHNSVKLVSSQE